MSYWNTRLFEVVIVVLSQVIVLWRIETSRDQQLGLKGAKIFSVLEIREIEKGQLTSNAADNNVGVMKWNIDMKGRRLNHLAAYFQESLR